MNKPLELLIATASYIYTVESMQKMIAEMLNDPELGRRSRVVSVLDVGGRKYSAGQQPDPITMPVLPRYGFGYIIKPI